MSSICLSLAPNLRCEKLNFPESIGLIVPPSLEIIFCISLVVIKHGPGIRCVAVPIAHKTRPF